ncbi:hypothetical protein EC844_10338 [Acinetobacter calcoaceticus]|uniref:Uncharacterized protein n=1 Tax=Acinetobacter calcoaceticus TaxID=471 RepID=A0A4R1Y2M7_ACICA|nr:hypothetical protein EC844_10338 [Acinetobacter calcoaceticus]
MNLTHFVSGLLMLVITQSVSANIFSTIDEVSVQPGSPGGTEYLYRFTIHSWETSPGSAASMTPNPCYGEPVCTVAINHRETAAGTAGYTGANPQCAISRGTTTARTMADLGELYKASCPIPVKGYSIHRSVDSRPPAFPECVGLFYTLRQSLNANEGMMLPGMRCGIAPPPVGYCYVDQANILFDHGRLSAAEIQSGTNSVTRDLKFTCNRGFNVQLFLLTGDEVKLGSNIISKLSTTGGAKIDGYQFFGDINGTILPITSTLHSQGEVGRGVFTGSTILIMTVP